MICRLVSPTLHINNAKSALSNPTRNFDSCAKRILIRSECVPNQVRCVWGVGGQCVHTKSVEEVWITKQNTMHKEFSVRGAEFGTGAARQHRTRFESDAHPRILMRFPLCMDQTCTHCTKRAGGVKQDRSEILRVRCGTFISLYYRHVFRTAGFAALV